MKRYLIGAVVGAAMSLLGTLGGDGVGTDDCSVTSPDGVATYVEEAASPVGRPECTVRNEAPVSGVSGRPASGQRGPFALNRM